MSGHTADIWGRPWSPCGHCPHPTPGGCAARGNRRLCALAHPDHHQAWYWRPRVAGMPAEDRAGSRLAAATVPGPAPARSHPEPAPGDAGPLFARGIDPRGRTRLGLASPLLALGGGQQWTLDLCRAVNPDRVVVRGLAYHNPGTDADLLRAARQRAPTRVGPGAIAELGRAVDVLVIWGLEPFRAYLAPSEAPPKLVVVSHGVGEWSRITCSQAASADAAVAVSPAAVSVFPPEVQPRVRVIPNAVGPDRVRPHVPRPEVRARWGVPEDVPVLGYLGRLSDDKHLDGLIAAAEALPEPWHVVLVGSGFAAQWVKDLADRSTARARIRFPGPTDDVGSALHAFDAYYSGSPEEGFGLAVVEALLAGVPVVGTATGVLAMHPGLARPLPFQATGEQIAAAVLADRVDATRPARVRDARVLCRERYTMAAFGSAWTDLIVSLAPPAPPARAVAVRRPPGYPAHPAMARVTQLRRCRHRATLGCGCQCTLLGRAVHPRDDCGRCPFWELRQPQLVAQEA